MSLITGGLLLGFGPTGIAPEVPVLTIDPAGAVATITGSTSSGVNTVYVANSLTGQTTLVWEAIGSRLGDGTVLLTGLNHGRYWAQVTTVTPGGSSISNLVWFRVGMPSGQLIHSPAAILRQLLLVLNQGSDPAFNDEWPLYVSSEPNTPDDVVTLYDSGGGSSTRTMIDGERQEKHGIQVRIRSKIYAVGFTKARLIAVTMDQEIYRETVVVEDSTYYIHSVSRPSDVLALGRDPSSNRFLFTIDTLVAMRALN